MISCGGASWRVGGASLGDHGNLCDPVLLEHGHEQKDLRVPDPGAWSLWPAESIFVAVASPQEQQELDRVGGTQFCRPPPMAPKQLSSARSGLPRGSWADLSALNQNL